MWGASPRGRITEFFGPESSGKTTLGQHIIAEAQKLGGKAAYIDVEHALDPAYAATCGVILEDLLIAQPDTGEEALEIVETLVRSNAIDVIIVDSVAALVPRAEIEGEMGDSHVGLQARLMSQALRKLTASIGRTGTAVVFINQLIEKVGIVYGNPSNTRRARTQVLQFGTYRPAPHRNHQAGRQVTARALKPKSKKQGCTSLQISEST